MAAEGVSTVNDVRTASVQAWSSVAAAWDELADQVDEQLAPATEWMLDAAAVGRGDRVLELAAGPGTLSARAAGEVGETGSVICSDFSEAMVEVARRRVDGAPVEFRVLDAEALDLPDRSVDVVLSRCGYMLMADPDAAFRESARVLDAGGRLALAVWGDAAANPWAALPMRVVAGAVAAAPPPPGAPGLWALADVERLRRSLGEAGFGEVRVETLDATVSYPSLREWLDRVSRLAAPLRAMLDGADDAARAAILHELAAAAAQYEQPDGSMVLPQRFVLGSGRRV